MTSSIEKYEPRFSKEEKQYVSQTILKHIGAMNLMAIGARNYGVSEDDRGIYLSFQVTIVSGGVSHFVKIHLTSADLYDVVLLRVRGSSIKREVEVSGLYNDQLGKCVYDICSGNQENWR